MEKKQKRRILVVDDDERISDLLSEFCADLGYDVKVVNQSPLAAGVALEWRPHLITLDLEMPSMDGLEVLSVLRSRPETKDIPILVISVIAREADVPREEVQGVFDKPVRFRRLLEHIETLLGAVAA